MKRVLWLFLIITYFALSFFFVPAVYAQSCGQACNPPVAGGSCSNPKLTCTFSITVFPPGFICECPADEVCTALGCLSADPNTLIPWILGRVIPLGGGIAFLLMVFGGFQVITSSGNPEGVKKGTEMITAAVSGLIFIIFSLFLLKLIGIDILHIPGFQK